jgi:hypothetical protein
MVSFDAFDYSGLVNRLEGLVALLYEVKDLRFGTTQRGGQ